MKDSWNNTDGEEKNDDRSNTARFTTTHLKTAKRKSKLAILDKRPTTNRLSHGMFFLVMTAYSLVREPKRFGGSCFRHHFQDLP
jgi:hypothetical protein